MKKTLKRGCKFERMQSYKVVKVKTRLKPRSINPNASGHSKAKFKSQYIMLKPELTQPKLYGTFPRENNLKLTLMSRHSNLSDMLRLLSQVCAEKTA